MTQEFWGSFATYMGKYASNKTKVNFDDGNSSALKKSPKSLKNTASFVKNSSQSCAISKMYIFWKHLENQKLIGGETNSYKTKVSFQILKFSLA